MKLPQDLLDLMGKRITFCRVKPREEGQEAQLVMGDGHFVGVILDPTNRLKVLARQLDDQGRPMSWTLEPMCINPSQAQVEAYFKHQQSLQVVVDNHNLGVEIAIKSCNKKVEEMNNAGLGEPMVLENATN